MKAYTNIDQSKILAEILPLDSADMARCGGENVIMTDYISAKKKFSVCGELTITPCWSLAALLDVLPYPSLHKISSGWRCDFYDKEGTFCISGELADNPIDACYKMIFKLKEMNLI